MKWHSFNNSHDGRSEQLIKNECVLQKAQIGYILNDQSCNTTST